MKPDPVWTDWFNGGTQYVRGKEQLGTVSYNTFTVSMRDRVYVATAKCEGQTETVRFSESSRPNNDSEWVTTNNPEWEAIEWVVKKVAANDKNVRQKLQEQKAEQKESLRELLDIFVDGVYERPPSYEDGDGASFKVQAIYGGQDVDGWEGVPNVVFSVSSEKIMGIIS